MPRLGLQPLPPVDGFTRYHDEYTGLVLRRAALGGPMGYITEQPGTLTWSALMARPDLLACVGAEVIVTGAAAGRYASRGDRWLQVGAATRLYSHGADVTTVASAAEQVLASVPIPAGRWRSFDRLRLLIGVADAGATDAFTLRFRLGVGATPLTDTTLLSLAVAAAVRTVGTELLFKRLAGASVRREGSDTAVNSLGGTATTAPAAAVAVTDPDTNALVLSVTAQAAATTDTLTLRELVADLIDHIG